MKAEMFDKIVEASANERVQRKISAFKDAVDRAYRTLMVCPPYSSIFDASADVYPEAKKVIGILVSGDTRRGWPSRLWEREREAVSKELLATMDEMQKALLAAEKAEPGENRPEESEEDYDA